MTFETHSFFFKEETCKAQTGCLASSAVEDYDRGWDGTVKGTFL